MKIESITAVTMAALITNYDFRNIINHRRPAYRASGGGLDAKPGRMNWKQTNETEARATYMGVEVVRVYTPKNLYYYLSALPSMQFPSEADVKNYITKKHRAA